MHQGVITMRCRFRFMAAFLAATAAVSSAQAIQLESWDKKIDRPARFVMLNAFNGDAVLDRETQLVWVHAPRDQLRTYSGAFNSCYATEIGGRLGWRLPTMPEVTSLLDRTQSFPPLPPGHPFDVSALTHDVWTASTVQGTDEAYTQDVTNDGFLGSFAKTGLRNYWCVRGGGGVEGK
jgi:hypothetical protein